MTFNQFFTQVQALIATQIDLPFDCLFCNEWLAKYTPEFEMYHKGSLTPDEAVELHFADIESKARNLKRNRTLMKK